MVRNYQPRNPFDPKSKLSPSTTLHIIHYLLAGRPSAWIAEKEAVSKNTVSALSARFRRKLQTSEPVRQSCFEVFYEHGYMPRELYVHLLDGPDAAPQEFFEDLAHCVFRCPAEISIANPGFPKFLRTSERRLLNSRQTQSFLEVLFGDKNAALRQNCQACPLGVQTPIGPIFPVAYHTYLRVRNLRIEHVREYFLLFTAHYYLHLVAMEKVGVRWSPDEIFLPDEADWPKLPEMYIRELNALIKGLLDYVQDFLVEYPLS
jgi:hypothetical protein